MARSAEQHSVVGVAPDDRLLVAYSRMKLYDISQLPVMDQDQIVGLLDESDLLLALHGDTNAFQRPVKSIMSQKLTTVQVTASVESILPIFERGLVVIVCDGPRFLGLITRIDVLNYLRRKLS
jgi:cystathionine beta-synthase